MSWMKLNRVRFFALRLPFCSGMGLLPGSVLLHLSDGAFALVQRPVFLFPLFRQRGELFQASNECLTPRKTLVEKLVAAKLILAPQRQSAFGVQPLLEVASMLPPVGFIRRLAVAPDYHASAIPSAASETSTDAHRRSNNASTQPCPRRVAPPSACRSSRRLLLAEIALDAINHHPVTRLALGLAVFNRMDRFGTLTPGRLYPLERYPIPLSQASHETSRHQRPLP